MFLRWWASHVGLLEEVENRMKLCDLDRLRETAIRCGQRNEALGSLDAATVLQLVEIAQCANRWNDLIDHLSTDWDELESTQRRLRAALSLFYPPEAMSEEAA